MSRRTISLLVLLLLCVPCWAGNDFSSDPNCKALWNFEGLADGVWLQDSIGTNTLVSDQAEVDTVKYKTGIASLYLDDQSSGLYQLDTNLDSRFPLRSDDAVKKFSICFWVRFDLFNINDNVIFAKWDTQYARTIALVFLSPGDPYQLCGYLGYEGGASFETMSLHSGELETAVWYHVGFTYDDSDKSYRVRCWDSNDVQLLAADVTGNTTNNINVEAGADWCLGRMNSTPNSFTGNMDEVVVFDRILTADEIDEIRAGTFGASAGGQVVPLMITGD